MNKQAKSRGRRGIEWTDFSWNPVGGCRHGCRWLMPDGSLAVCYAETVAERLAQSAYPEGFAHHYWRPDVLERPLRIQRPSRIFLDSMSDLMGHWVPSEQIESVLDVCRRAYWHQFQLLTKNAPRLKEFQFPPNVWVGVSAPPSIMFGKSLTLLQQQAMLRVMLTTLRELTGVVRWISIEPLSFDIAPLLQDFPLEWAVIGAATNGRCTYQPKPEWVRSLLHLFDVHQTPVFFKGNLHWSERREQFPTANWNAEQKV